MALILKQGSPVGASVTLPFGVDDIEPFTAIANKVYLLNRSEPHLFRLLTNCLRLRVNDQMRENKVAMEGSVHQPGLTSSELALHNFLLKAEHAGILPSWFDEDKRRQCIKWGRDYGKLERDMDEGEVNWLLRKQWYPDDNAIIAKLRALGEKIYGTPVGKPLLDRMVALEQGKAAG